MFAEPIPLEEGDITRLVEFFRLLDSWDQRCRLSLIACNTSTPYAEPVSE